MSPKRKGQRITQAVKEAHSAPPTQGSGTDASGLPVPPHHDKPKGAPVLEAELALPVEPKAAAHAAGAPEGHAGLAWQETMQATADIVAREMGLPERPELAAEPYRIEVHGPDDLGKIERAGLVAAMTSGLLEIEVAAAADASGVGPEQLKAWVGDIALPVS